MKQAKELVDALRAILGGDAPVFPAVVTEVDKVMDTCEIEFNGLELGGVRLVATINEDAKGCKLYPKVGSVVLCQRLGDKGELLVIMYSEVEQVLYKVDDTVLDIKDGFLLKRQNETLKKLVEDTLDAIIAMKFTTAYGPTINLVNKPVFEAIKQRVPNLLK